MKRDRIHVFLAVLSLNCVLTNAAVPRLIGTPYAHPTAVGASGAVREHWGTVSFAFSGQDDELIEPTRQEWLTGSVPAVATTLCDGPLRVTALAYRAPVWPSGFDVVRVTFTGSVPGRHRGRLMVTVPEGVEYGGGALVRGGSHVATMAPAQLLIKNAGCITDTVATPGWGRPAVTCDAAFRNIRVGNGGTPITYELAVPPGSGCRVALGLCESYWSESGHRPLRAVIEGAAEQTVDPVSAWGQHQPGLLWFDARDADADGLVTLNVLPGPGATDLNTILNAVWVFPGDTAVDPAAVMAGHLNAQALHYIDVGGPNDGPVTEPGHVVFADGRAVYSLDVRDTRSCALTFLLACPGGGAPPSLERTSWTADSLWQAAEDVWSGWFGDVDVSRCDDPQQVRMALAEIAMTATQADAFYAALPAPGRLDSFSWVAAARIVEALDVAGQWRDSERLLRVFWDRPVPAPLAEACAVGPDGSGSEAGAQSCHARAHTVLALASHARFTRSPDWRVRVYPAIQAGARHLADLQAAATPVEERAWSALALRVSAAAARALGRENDAAWMTAAAATLATDAPDTEGTYAGLGRCVDAASLVVGALSR